MHTHARPDVRQPSMWCIQGHKDADRCLQCDLKTHRIHLRGSVCVHNHTYTNTHITHTSSSLASTLLRCVRVQHSPLTSPTSPLPFPAVSPSPWHSITSSAKGGAPKSLISYPKNKAAPTTLRLPLPLERLKKKIQNCVTL